MDEGGVDRERQPIIISNLLFGSEESVADAFVELNPEEERSLLTESNPSVLTDLERLIEPYAEEKSRQTFWGAMLFHRVLREIAERKGVTLPTFTEEFIEDYAKQKDSEAERYRIEAVRDRNLSDEAIKREFRRRNIATFRNLEPEFSNIVEAELKRGLGDQSENWISEDDDRYIGIIDQYLLFRAGHRDPNNFQR